MVEMKEITARAVGIVERLAQYTAVEKAEVLAIAQQIVNVELARSARGALTQTHLPASAPSQGAYGQMLPSMKLEPEDGFADRVIRNVKHAIGVSDE